MREIKNHGLSFGVYEILPTEAEEILTRPGIKNRPISRANLDRIKSDIKSGRWSLNGEPIIFDKYGRLNDGQHRLTGCVESGSPIITVAVFGVDPETFATLDDGAKRTLCHTLTINGEINAGALSAAVSAFARLDKTSNLNIGEQESVSKALMTEILDANPKLRDWVIMAEPLRRIGARSSLAAILYIASDHGKFPAKPATFIDKLARGDNMSLDNPAFQLRDRLLKEKASRSKLSNKGMNSLVITAWNAYASDRSMPKLTIPYYRPSKDDNRRSDIKYRVPDIYIMRSDQV